jgi:hypothetical protein
VSSAGYWYSENHAVLGLHADLAAIRKPNDDARRVGQICTADDAFAAVEVHGAAEQGLTLHFSA